MASDKFKRPEVMEGYTLKLGTGVCGSFFLTLNEHDSELKEIRMQMGKSGSCQNMLFRVIALLLSILLQENVSKEKIRKTLEEQLMGYGCGNKIHYNKEEYSSCIDFAVQRMLEDLFSREEANA